MAKIIRKILTRPCARMLLIALALLPVMLSREITPVNEAKYLDIADEAIRDGHFWCMYHGGEVYADKPPLYFWLLMGFKAIFGRHVVPLLELMSLVPALAVILILDKWCSSTIKPSHLWAAELTLATCAWFLGSSLVLRMDFLMVMFITLALRTFWTTVRSPGGPSAPEGTKNLLLFGLWIFLAIFTKGPVGILLPLAGTLTYLFLSGQRSLIPKVWGWRTWAVIVSGCAIWLAGAALEGGSTYMHNLLVHQTLGRAVNSFHHDAPPFYYLYSIWYIMAPWSPLILGTIAAALIRKVRLSELTRFLLAVSASFFVMMSCFSCKLQIYLLPILGFLTYGAFSILSCRNRRTLINIMGIGSATILLAAFLVGIFWSDLLNKTF